MNKMRNAKFKIGQVVRHRLFPFRGVVFDIDPEFNNTEEWYQSIPAEVRPHKDQPFYHLFAENAESEYIAYVSEQNLLPDTSGEPVAIRRSPGSSSRTEGRYRPRNSLLNCDRRPASDTPSSELCSPTPETGRRFALSIRLKLDSGLSLRRRLLAPGLCALPRTLQYVLGFFC